MTTTMVPDLTVDEGRRDMNPSTQEIQQNELEALRAIYMDDYKDVKPETVWKIAQYAPEFVVKIRSLDEQYREKVHVGLHVRFTKTYPNTAPQLALQEVFGLNDSQVSVAIQELQKKASQMIGSEMVYDLCTWLEEYVTNNNIADQITGHSFHDEMMQRAKARNEDIQKQARKIRQHQLEQQREDRQKLEEMIKAEVTRKEENLLKQKRHLSYSLASGEDPESMYRMVGQWAHQLRELRFESPVTVDHQPGVARSNMFNSVVLERTGLRNGLYRVMNAYPIDPDLIGHVNRAQRYIVHEYVIDNDYYLEGGSGEKELQKVVHEIQELTYVRHAHLVPVYATMIQAMEGKGQRLYVLMESYGEAIGSNNTLRTVLNMCGSVGVGKARVYLKQILLALVHLHAAGFVHRSLEPEVVLLVPPASPLSTTGENNISSVSSYGAPSVKLFCVSYREKLQALNRVAPLSSLHRDARDDEDRVKRVAPEVVDHPGMIGRKCDIWSVGIIGLEMIFGRDIVESVEMGREPELLEKYRSELQQSLARVLTKMLAKQPEDRPTAMELLTDPFFSEGVPKREPSVLQLALDSASQGLRHEQNKSFVYSSHGGTTPIDQATSRPRQHSTTYFNIANLRLQPEESEIVGVGGVSIVPVEASSAAMQGLDRKAPAYSLPPIPSQDQAPSADVSSDSDTVARPRRQIVIGRHTQPAPRPSGASVAAQSGLGAPRNEAMIPTQPHMQSRYRTDFQEIEFLGKGGFGSVVKARNIIDGRFYAIKKIKLNSRKMDEGSSNKIFREVTTLSRLHHQNVVRYYTTWVEYVPKGTENIRLAGDSSEEDQDNEEASFLELDSIATFDDQSRQRGVSATSSSNGSEPSMLEMSQAPRTNPASEATDTGNGDGAGGEEGDYVSFSAEYDGQFNTDPFVGPGTTGLYSSLRFGTMGGRNVPPKARNGKKNFGITTVVPATAASSFTSYSESEDESESDNGCACDDSEISIEFESEPCEVKSNGGVAFAPKARGAQESSYASSRSVSSSSSSTTSSRGGSRALAARSRYLHQRKASADDQFDKILYIQMEYCENKTLSDLIAEGIEENEMWRLFRQTLEGLVHIHSCGMIHRDLKPVNIFLSASGDIKIGDFGLATSNYAPIEGPAASGDRQKRGSARRGGNELRGVDATFTADIGTSMYVAPEVANRSSSTHIRYNQKVDMYSLGVILFEMCYPVNTGMERANVIMRLRKQQIEFPPDFPIEQKRLQYQIIRQLLNHNPHQRPSSVELLESGLLPSKMEKEHIRETIHTIANPDQPYYNTLLSTLFSRYTDTHIDATFDYRSVNTAKEQINAVYLDRIREYMIHTFRKHAAIELTTPLMVPKLKEIGYDSFINVAQYLDASGNVVGLPVDPVIPFSRYVARTNLREIKRFCFDRFYRENSAGGQPISGNVASFDIVTNEEAHAVGASEVITVVMDILSDFPAFRNSPLVIMLNHCDVLESILFRVTQYLAEQQIGGAGNVFASLPKHRQASEIGMVYGLLRRYYSTNGSKSQVVRDEIGASLFGSTGLFNIMNNDMRSQLKKLLTGYYRDLAEYKSAVAEFLGEDGLGGFSSIYTLETRKEALIHLQRVQVAFAELEHLISTLELFEIDIDSVVYCPLFTYHRVYYRHGYCFQVLTKSKYPEVLAIGGRYDHLIKQFKYLVNDPATYPQPSAADEAIEDSTMAAAAANSSSMSLRDLVTEYKQIAHTTIARQPTTSGSAALGTGKGVVGFGACFSLDKITQSMAKFEEDLLAHSSVPSFGLWTRKRCDVVVASFGSKNLLKERVELARDLWANQIRADFLYNDDPGMSMEALMSICRDQGMNWIVTLKRKSASKADSELNSGHLSVSSSSSSLYHPREQISKFIYKVRDILQKTEKEVSRDELCPWLFSKIQERYQIDCVIHETKSTTKVSTGSMTSASLAHLFEPMMISKEHQQLIASSSGSNSILGNIPVSVPEQQHSSLVLASDERRFEVVFVDPNQAGKNLNRVKAKQKSMLTDRATGNVKKALGELRTNAPIIIVPLNSTAIRKLLGMESILGEEGFKKIMEGSSAHQRVHITRLRSQLERFKRQGSKLVWLYSSPDDYAVTYKM